jgi:recombination protein RecA
VPTGSLALDIALGVGGIPRGRIVEIYGPEASGKTTLVYHLIAQAQRLGGQAAFIDAEHAMDPIYAKAIGVDVDNLLVSQPDYGEQALEIAEMLVRSGALDIVAIDSVAALTPKAEIEGEMGDSFVGLQARLMSQALRKLAGTLNRSGTICCFTNQLREKIGVMFGNPRPRPAARPSSSTRPCASTSGASRRSKTAPRPSATGCASRSSRTRWRRRSGRPSSTSCTAQGISHEGSLLDLGVQFDVVQKSGAFYSFADDRLGPRPAQRAAVPQGEPRHRGAIEAAGAREGRAARRGRRRRRAAGPVGTTAYDVGAE